MVIETESNIGIVHNFLMNVRGYSSDMQLQLQTLITNVLEDLFEMKGAFVVTNGSNEAQIYSKSIKIVNILKFYGIRLISKKQKFFQFIFG